MPGQALLQRQIAKSTRPEGDLDIQALLALVAAAYAEKDLDRRRADRASQLVAEELDDACASLEVQNVRFRAALDNMAQGLCLFDRGGRVAVCNKRFFEIYGIASNSVKPAGDLLDLLSASSALRSGAALEARLLAADHDALDRRKGGALEQAWPDGRLISIIRRPVADGGFLDTVSDVTESRQAAARISHQARHDALTDLPNRVLLRERLARAVEDGRRGGTSALLFLDLDRFKSVNDTLGHPVGDALLVAVAKRLRGLVRADDMVARLGGDEFAILQSQPASTIVTEVLARRILSALAAPFEIAGNTVQVSVSVGIEVIDGSAGPDEVLRNADIALYRAKSEGRGAYRQFDAPMLATVTERRQLEMDLRAALTGRQLEVHYQPQIDLHDGEICGFEALVRWRHPTRGLVGPGEFIALAEEVGLIDALGAFVLDAACDAARSWPEHVKVAVNLSALQFRSRKFVASVEQALQKSGLAPGRLELEITESVMLDDVASVLGQLRQLKALGVNISLDDFGTGYSSLSYIRSFPFDRIKIDQSFVRELESSADSLAIIRAVTGLCGSLGITTTADGVETDAQLRILAGEKCDSVQGYLFGKPTPFAETHRLFERPPFGRAA